MASCAGSKPFRDLPPARIESLDVLARFAGLSHEPMTLVLGDQRLHLRREMERQNDELPRIGSDARVLLMCELDAEGAIGVRALAEVLLRTRPVLADELGRGLVDTFVHLAKQR